MDQQQAQVRGRSSSATSTGGGGQSLQQPQVKNEPSPAGFSNPTDAPAPSIGLGIGLDASSAQQFGSQTDYSTYDQSNNFLNPQQQQNFSQGGLADPTFDLNQDFTQQLKSEDPTSFGLQTQGGYTQNLLAQDFSDGDFTIFPPTTGEQFSSSLFVGEGQQLAAPENNMMSQPHSPTPPHLLQPEPHQPSSANHSPSFNQHQFSSSPGGGHSRTVSLGPEAALMPGQVDWSQPGPQFQGHRRSPSEYSDVSSVAPSPLLASSDTFDQVDHNHSPMQQPHDAGVYSELHGISSFSISDQGTHSPNQHAGRSPSHSPAISPRIPPQQMPDMAQQNPYMLQAQDNGFGPSPYAMQGGEAFPTLSQGVVLPDMQGSMQAPPAINIDFAPPAIRSGFDPTNKSLDVDSLTPPERGRPRSRPRAVTDPYNNSGTLLTHRTPSASGSLSPNIGSDARSDSSRSLSPLDRSGPGSIATSPSRRRQSTSAVPNNVIALRLADPDYTGPGSQGDSASGAKRIQKHPATFQCTLCPKRFTRAYNLRSHFRTHTDERPFVCTVCGKAFARQHDRKRHEGLHSGEKKFVCKGDLKAGGQWGCGRRFARADALGRHFRSEAGRICIKPLLDEEANERQRTWNEQRMQQAAAQGMVMQTPGMMMPGIDPNAGAYPGDAGAGGYAFPQALLAQYPALATMNWTADMSGGGSGMEDEMSGRSSFDASDYDEGDDGGYVSGPGTGYGQGGLSEGFGEMGYASDYGGR